MNFKRRHLYPERVAHRRANTLLASLILSVFVLSWIVATPAIAQEPGQAPQGLIGPIEPVPTKVGGTAEQNATIAYAWQLSHDMDFIYTLNGENGKFDYQRVHDPRANTVGTDMGYCGINSYFHPEVVTDPRFFTDQTWQMQQCYKMWKGGVKFYGYSKAGILTP